MTEKEPDVLRQIGPDDVGQELGNPAWIYWAKARIGQLEHDLNNAQCCLNLARAALKEANILLQRKGEK